MVLKYISKKEKTKTNFTEIPLTITATGRKTYKKLNRLKILSKLKKKKELMKTTGDDCNE